MSSSLQLHLCINQLTDWLKHDALPYWTTSGINPHNGAVYEQMLFNGQPDLAANQRVRVQARQIMVFCAAQQQQWLNNSLPIVSRIVAFMHSHGRISPTAIGYVQLLTPDNQIVGPKLDSYDFAFYFLACFHRFSTFNDKQALDEANALLWYMDVHFKNGSAGWLEGNYSTPHRRQNPHMHLFEAFMTGYEVTRDGKWLAKAGQIFSLFEQYFFNPKTHVLHEHFDANWQLAEGQAGESVEPGHMFEWVWLLRWYERLTATPVGHYCDALYQKALTIGCDPLSQLIYDVVDTQGTIIKGTKRCWPLTELVKASLAQATVCSPAQRQFYEDKAALGIQLLFDFYQHPTIKGSYIDQIAPDNTVVADHAPASTLYHFAVMGVEANKYKALFL
ncbi:AGE family epimerase/isomerase [Paraglaciecola hydrolytica]|uniref:Mannose-6-phosphate isomerase n=1 Tax=Paraglaciecola hydrolytica TaxID=1799789 RepID=A0A148KN93_9ALTE|nr:AGE family epimerase/isomerase [Paraglaciecola hydrolytica]KXI27782.1 hypothetical protein AX660_19805 [Paraglaciecola hydrolytica]